MARLTPETELFLRKAVAGLPFLKRSEAKDELRAHLEDAIEQRVSQDAANASVEGKAVAALGDVAELNTARMKLRALEDAIRERRAQNATPAHEEHEAADLTPPNHATAREEIRALEDLRQGLAQHIARLQAEQETVAALGDPAALNRELLRAHYGRKWPLHYLRERLVRWHIHMLRGPFRFTVRVVRDRSQRLVDEGRYGEAIALAKRELASRGPSFLAHDRLAAHTSPPAITSAP